MAVYTGTGYGSLTQIAANDDKPASGKVSSQVVFNATAGTEYLIAVDVARHVAPSGSVLRWSFGRSIGGRVTQPLCNNRGLFPPPVKALSGVTVTLSGTLSRTAVTDANGWFSFTELTPGGNYQVAVPSLTSSTIGYANLQDFLESASFSIKPELCTTTFSLSGYVRTGSGIAYPGVTMTVTGTTATGASLTRSTTTDNTGSFLLSGIPKGNYSLQPQSRTSYAVLNFTPGALNFTSLSDDALNLPFTITVSQELLSIGGQVRDSSNNPVGGATLTLTGAQAGTAQTDSGGKYAFSGLPSGGSYTVTATKASATFVQPTLTFGPLTATQKAADFTVVQGASGNPIDVSANFVRQHYLDFLNREPDTSGLNFWVGEIEGCAANAGCREVKRINVSAAFFLSIEFQETGYLAYRAHKAAFGNIAGKPVPIIREEMMLDQSVLGSGLVVGAQGWEQKLEQNKQAYFGQLVGSARFTALYPQTLTPAQFVDALNANAAGALSASERNSLVADLTSGAKDRARVLRAVTEDPDLNAAEKNKAFVLMQYFGYLRRNPDNPPDSDFGGWNFWLGKLNEFGGNFVNAEMVKAFISSDEYRKRFGQ